MGPDLSDLCPESVWSGLIEIILDVGQYPELRFNDRIDVLQSVGKITEDHLKGIETRMGGFNDQNRAGLNQTLHRVSALWSNQGKLLGVTIRLGRSIQGCLDGIESILDSDESILFVAPPGKGKTTKLREAARILSTQHQKRVMIVDSSNEIAGMGDVVHKGVGRARRLQVLDGSLQADKMIEAVENHMPEVLIVDEIGTVEKAEAARSISERGVRLIASAHGHSLANIIKNPTLVDLVGGIQAVILGDDEARFRGCQKTILERKALPTFNIMVEIESFDSCQVIWDVKQAVDQYLRGEWEQPESTELQTEDLEGTWVYPFGVNTHKLSAAIKTLNVNLGITQKISDADFVLTTRSKIKGKSKLPMLLKGKDKQLHIIRIDTEKNIRDFLRRYFDLETSDDEIEDEVAAEIVAICDTVHSQKQVQDASPRNAFFRKIQHEIVESKGLHSVSVGTEPNRRVRVFPS